MISTICHEACFLNVEVIFACVFKELYNLCNIISKRESKLNDDDHVINSFTSNLEQANVETVVSHTQFMIEMSELRRMKSYWWASIFLVIYMFSSSFQTVRLEA